MAATHQEASILSNLNIKLYHCARGQWYDYFLLYLSHGYRLMTLHLFSEPKSLQP
jgi:hypothetical protein